MPDNLQVQKNAVPNQSSANIREAFWQLKVNDNHNGSDGTQSSPHPDRPKEPDCLYYLRTGVCGYGSTCRFNHPNYILQNAYNNGDPPERVGQPDCEYFLKTGTCKYGSSCKYHHPRDRHGAEPVKFNNLGLPMRQEEKSCPYYMRTGLCKFGVACKFHHPQPTSLGNLLPLARSGAFGASGSTVVPSSGLPYLSGLPMWSLPGVPYMHVQHVQGQQSYMPVISVSQSILPGQGWNTYVDNTSLSSPTIVGSNLIYHSRNPSDLGGSVGLMHVSSTPSHTLPERADQPECRYFKNTGTCKYGSSCKFYHQNEKIFQSATNPLGFPSRPGKGVCSNYTMYGICKYGSTCKFDHPFAGHPYNYSFTSPFPSMLDSSSHPSYHPRNKITTFDLSPTTESSPLTSFKSTEWVRKSSAVSNVNQKLDTKTPQDSPEEATSPTITLPESDHSG